LLIPVPGGTADIADLLDGGEAAFSVVEVVTLIARLAGSSVVEGGALVRDGDANSEFIEDPVVGAFDADLLVPVPLSAAYVRDLLDGGELASSVVQVVTSIA